MDSHYAGIVAGYAAATAVVWLLWRVARPFVAAAEPVSYNRPWIEVGLVILAAVATIGIGQAYVRHMLLPDEGVALRSLNQAVIFAPLLLVAFLRPPGTRGAGLPLGPAVAGLPIGAVLGGGAIFLYALVRGYAPSAVYESVLDIGYVPHAAQVLFEDIAIAALLLRLRAALGFAWAVVLVAVLFAAGHIPAMLANGADLSGLTSLALDTGIGVMVVAAVLATRSVWWFWPLHVAMDLTQFFEPSG